MHCLWNKSATVQTFTISWKKLKLKRENCNLGLTSGSNPLRSASLSKINNQYHIH
jgi:hypothetical protein